MDSTLIGAFGSAIAALSAAIGALWYKLNTTEKECREDRLLLWRELMKQKCAAHLHAEGS